MPDPADYGNDRAAEFNADRLADHQAMMANRPEVSALACEDCGEPIPEERRRKSKGCTRCIDCQRDIDPKRRR